MVGKWAPLPAPAARRGSHAVGLSNGLAADGRLDRRHFHRPRAPATIVARQAAYGIEMPVQKLGPRPLGRPQRRQPRERGSGNRLPASWHVEQPHQLGLLLVALAQPVEIVAADRLAAGSLIIGPSCGVKATRLIGPRRVRSRSGRTTTGNSSPLA